MTSLSCVRLFVTPWTAAYQAPPSMGFSRQEYPSGLPLPSLLLRWCSGKKSVCHCRRHVFHPWVRMIPWRRKWQPTPVFLFEESHAQEDYLMGYSPWCHRESDVAKQLSMHYNTQRSHGDRNNPKSQSRRLKTQRIFGRVPQKSLS